MHVSFLAARFWPPANKITKLNGRRVEIKKSPATREGGRAREDKKSYWACGSSPSPHLKSCFP